VKKYQIFLFLICFNVYAEFNGDLSISYEGEKIKEGTESTKWEQDFNCDLSFDFDIGYIWSIYLENEYEENTSYKLNDTSLSLNIMPGFSHFIILTVSYQDSTDLDDDNDDDFFEKDYLLYYTLDIHKNHTLDLNLERNIREYTEENEYYSDYKETFSYLEYEWEIANNFEMTLHSDYNINKSTEAMDTYKTNIYEIEFETKIGNFYLTPEFSYETSDYDTEEDLDDYLQRNYNLEIEFKKSDYFLNFEIEPEFEMKRYKVYDSFYLDYNEFSWDTELVFSFLKFYDISFEYEYGEKSYIDYDAEDDYDATEEDYKEHSFEIGFGLNNRNNFEFEVSYKIEKELNASANSDEDYFVDDYRLCLEYKPFKWLAFQADNAFKQKQYKEQSNGIFSDYNYYDFEYSLNFEISKKIDIELRYEREKEDYKDNDDNDEISEEFGIRFNIEF
jgi:hypothetical protein